MATMKKERQRLTMKIKKILGIDIALARRVARHSLDLKGDFEDIKGELTQAIGDMRFTTGCECCGDSSYTWTGKNGSMVYQYSTFKLIEKKA